MDIDRLKLFTTLAHWQHFHRAAEASYVSAPTLSRTIRQMEEELGVKLFNRDNRSVSLTPSGQTFLRYARDTLADWEQIKDTLSSLQGELHGTISLYCSVTASYSFLYTILSDFRLTHPKIDLKIHTGDPALALERVVFGREDIAIAMRPERMPKGIEFKPITSTPLVLIRPSESTFFSNQLDPLSQKFWDQVPLVVSEQGLARDYLDQWFGDKRITPRIYAQVAGHEAIVSMVSLGFGVGLVPQIVVDNSPLQDRVALFEYQHDFPTCDVGICVLDKNLKRPVIDAFWSQISV